MASYEDLYTKEQRRLAQMFVAMEKDALDKFYEGDTSGYQDLWSHDDFTYFDANTKERIDRYEDVYDFLMSRVEGKLHADSYEFLSPRVQFGADMAVLTYQLYADTNVKSTRYNVVEVYRKSEDGGWKVIHSTWDTIRPYDLCQDARKDEVII